MDDPPRVSFAVDGGRSVSGRLMHPEGARAGFVLAHGAGAGMDHPSVASVAAGLFDRGIATFRYQFPFMEAGSRRPDPPAVAQIVVRAAIDEASRLMPGLPLVAGGRSFGGRMTSQAQAASPIAGVCGLAFLAFPLHPAGRIAVDRAAHLRDVDRPMLFLQGTNDALAEISHLRSTIAGLSARARLHTLQTHRRGRQDRAAGRVG